MLFTDPPLTSARLAARLARAHFWTTPRLDVAIARNALVAAKWVGANSALTLDEPDKERHGRKVPIALSGIFGPQKDHHKAGMDLLERLYAHKPLLRLAPELWREIFVLEPKPSFPTAMRIVNNAPRLPRQAIYTALRNELWRENFVRGCAYLDVPTSASVVHVLGPWAASTSIGMLSAAVWMPALPISLLLCAFWMGLGWPGAEHFPRVAWQAHGKHGFIAKRRYAERLRMANMIVQYYEDLQGVTVDNYHRRAGERAPSEVQTALQRELSNRGMEIRAEPGVGLYADYWSPEYTEWKRLEWREPDQDPAELTLAKRPRYEGHEAKLPPPHTHRQ